METNHDNIAMPRELVEDLIYMATKWRCKTSAIESAIIEEGKLIRTIDYNKTIEEAMSALGRKAHWVGLYYHCACCSNCGGDIYSGFETTTEAREHWGELYRYCPHCGMPMDLSVPYDNKTKKRGRKSLGHV